MGLTAARHPPRSSRARSGSSVRATSQSQAPGLIGQRWAAFCVALLGVPLFLMVSPSGTIGLPTGPSLTERAGLLSVPISVALCISTLLVTRPARKRPDVVSACLGAFVLVNLVAFLVGALVYGLSGLAAAFLVQTFLPMIGYILGRRAGQFPDEWISRNLFRFAWVPLLCFAGIGLTTLAAGGSPWVYVGDALGPLAVPQARRYLPTVIAFSLLLFSRAAFARKSVGLPLLVSISVSLLLAASHSRTGLLIVAAGFAFFVLIDARARVGSRINWLVMACAAAAVFWFALGSADFEDAPVAVSRLSGNDASAQLSSERRASALEESITETFSTALGRMYQPTESASLGGVRADYSRVSNSENQIGEYGLRAGPVAVVVLTIAIGTILVRSRRALGAAVKASPEREGLWLATCATIGVSIFTQQALSQPYTGVVVWFALGMLASWSAEQAAPT